MNWLSATVERDDCARTFSGASEKPQAALLAALQLAAVAAGLWLLIRFAMRAG